jgi:hypothetical protein
LPHAAAIAGHDDWGEQGDEDGIEHEHVGSVSLACMRVVCRSYDSASKIEALGVLLQVA